MTPQPWDFMQAKTAAARTSRGQAQAEEDYKEASAAYSTAERAYRMELAKKMATLRADGQPATLIPDLAKGDERIATLKSERDLARGLLDAATHAIWRHNADRRDVQRFIDWSIAVSTGRAME